MTIKNTIPGAETVVYHNGFLYLKTQDGWFVDDLSGDPVQIKTSFDTERWVLAKDSLWLVGKHGLAEVSGLSLTEWPGLDKPWVPLGVPMDGGYSLAGVPSNLRDREEVHGLPITKTHTWWVSGQLGLKGSYRIVGGRPYLMQWVFQNKNPFVYWGGILGSLAFGEPPEEAVPYPSTVPIVGAKNAYYFSRDGSMWLMRRVEGWSFATKSGIGLYLPDGRIELLKGIL